ncbi:MAG: hypothetical protein ACOCRX_11620 [Candidatus Woesearchaeota archaeon]
MVECKQSEEPCFLKEGNNEEFYVKTNPATDELKRSSLVKYIENHFKNK